MHIDDNQNPFSLVADFEGDESSVFDVEMEATLPILPLRNMVLFPGVVMPVAVGRKSSLRLAKLHCPFLLLPPLYCTNAFMC